MATTDGTSAGDNSPARIRPGSGQPAGDSAPGPAAGHEGGLRVYTRHELLPRPLSAGALLVDKPPGLTSFGVVRRVRRALGVQKVGHAGTLDPMATGLLVVLVGREATRLQDRFMALPKVYTGTLRLGETTPSYDAETPVEVRRDASGVTDAALEALVPQFTGTLAQRPPAFSAVKVDGVRLYRHAHRGRVAEAAAMAPTRTVEVYSLAWTARRGADVDFRVHCSRGTYVRALARDVGEALRVGAHLVALRREAIGPFTADEAFALDALAPPAP
ncbi:MAG: tRNA pseudouridine(55) synthase TruB [Rubricoccaceae bacterium]